MEENIIEAKHLFDEYKREMKLVNIGTFLADNEQDNIALKSNFISICIKHIRKASEFFRKGMSVCNYDDKVIAQYLGETDNHNFVSNNITINLCYKEISLLTQYHETSKNIIQNIAKR